MASAYIKDEQGGTFIPASQRPDGTWRKPRRVKDGYIPQEEVPLYESKGKQFIKNKPIYPVGASPEFIAEHKAKQEALAAKAKVVPGTQVKVETKKKKKKNKTKPVEGITEELAKSVISENDINKAPVCNNKIRSNTESVLSNPVKLENTNALQALTADPQKRLKNLRKKMREIENLEEKMKNGSLKHPEKEILDKLARKDMILKEIKRLEEV